ncbi:MAG: ABC transporter permease, partial [Halobacteria archaeon]|nr:ABC transporter permease [Halobacteria archaeon]
MVEVKNWLRRALKDNRLVIMKRELASLRTEKTIVLALVIQLFIAAFSSFLVVGLVSLYDPASASSNGFVTFGVTGEAADELVSTMSGKEQWDVEIYGDYESAISAFRQRKVDAVLETNIQSDGQIGVTAVAPSSSLRTTLIVVQLKEVLKQFERQKRQSLSH